MFEKILKIRRDFQQLQKDEDSPSNKTIANSKKFLSVKIKRNERAMKRHSMGKMAKSNIVVRAANPFIRKIHIRIEKSIHITTNHCQIKNEDDYGRGNHLLCENDGDKTKERVLENSRKDIFPRNHSQLIDLAVIFGVRLIKELLVM